MLKLLKLYFFPDEPPTEPPTEPSTEPPTDPVAEVVAEIKKEYEKKITDQDEKHKKQVDELKAVITALCNGEVAKSDPVTEAVERINKNRNFKKEV